MKTIDPKGPITIQVGDTKHVFIPPPAEADTPGLVMCDDPDCTALENPTTLSEYQDALNHWRNHSSYGGCSHGC